MPQSPYSSSTEVASSVPFDNSTNGFNSTDVQSAIEESVHHLSATEVSATADTTTTSTTDVLINSMTITPVSGSYLVKFSSTVDHSNQNVAVVVSLYTGGVLKADSVRSTIPRTNAIGAITMSLCVAINGLVTVNGAQAIEIRWKTSAGTATAHQRTMDILRIT